MLDGQEVHVIKGKTAMQPLRIQEMLKETYWGKTRTVEDIIITLENSRCYGLFLGDKQIGFGRVLSDEVVYAYLSDVVIDKSHKGKGYARLLLDVIFNDPVYARVQRWNLVTKDTHELYKKYGFSTVADPTLFMEKVLVHWNDL